jgi:hypothetical protein
LRASCMASMAVSRPSVRRWAVPRITAGLPGAQSAEQRQPPSLLWLGPGYTGVVSPWGPGERRLLPRIDELVHLPNRQP